ncbi:MAG: type II toxin-antitoxin system RelE/ParE family toxin [Gammaproteobacteria bacterium]|nr:type II toxin-antitoxin system RelE/ParE family toxin [Gammaproteobacteria bacterium]MCH9764017.1 type II toxin-antitoxin system RelE/ParE family toxin [Gammaproteobacteria bacterium]
MKIIKTKWFSKWVNKNAVDDQALVVSAKEIFKGNYEANYGAGVIKKRVAHKGHGKSTSARTIVAYKHGKGCFFAYGFGQNAKSNISEAEEKAIKLLAKALFAYSEIELFEQIKKGALIEVDYEQE